MGVFLQFFTLLTLFTISVFNHNIINFAISYISRIFPCTYSPGFMLEKRVTNNEDVLFTNLFNPKNEACVVYGDNLILIYIKRNSMGDAVNIFQAVFNFHGIFLTANV